MMELLLSMIFEAKKTNGTGKSRGRYATAILFTVSSDTLSELLTESVGMGWERAETFFNENISCDYELELLSHAITKL